MIDKIEFPAVVFDNFSFRIVNNREGLVITTKAGLKNGLYDKITIVDSNGSSFEVTGAKKIKGVGPMWGYNIFLNQNILVELNFVQKVNYVALSDVKKEILKWLNKEKLFWKSGGNFKEIAEIIYESESIKTMIIHLDEVLNKIYPI
ncbi:hypothetical protein ACN9ML_17460 [Dyadobacter endophyticus]|uniref:hypothetical protein n=1 Tax=Dyadobacter endophyticus TaxID=1749036 RepID=UPI003CF410F8